MQTQTHHLRMVVTEKDGSLLADLIVHGRPSVNDLATLLAHALRRPLDGAARRPKLVCLRGQRRWKELFPVLEELGVEVSVERNLPGIGKAYRALVQEMREERRTKRQAALLDGLIILCERCSSPTRPGQAGSTQSGPKP